MSNIIFDIHNTIAFQNYSNEFFISRTYKKLTSELTQPIRFHHYKKIWLELDFEYQHETVKGYEALTNNNQIVVDISLREEKYLHKIELLFARLGLPRNYDLAFDINEYFQSDWTKGLTLYPFTIGVLEKLSNHNFGIVSNFRDAKWIKSWIRLKELEKFFHENVVISDEIGSRKPHPALFETIRSIMNIAPEQKPIYIGDNEIEDRLGAERAGFYPLIIGKDIDSIEELPSLLSKI